MRPVGLKFWSFIGLGECKDEYRCLTDETVRMYLELYRLLTRFDEVPLHTLPEYAALFAPAGVRPSEHDVQQIIYGDAVLTRPTQYIITDLRQAVEKGWKLRSTEELVFCQTGQIDCECEVCAERVSFRIKVEPALCQITQDFQTLVADMYCLALSMRRCGETREAIQAKIRGYWNDFQVKPYIH